MERKHNVKLLVKVLILGVVVALLSYLFHPEVGHISMVLNGQTISDPMVRLAAVPTFLVVMGLTALLMVVLFLGVGIVIFFGMLVFAFLICALLAPYFSPMLMIIFLFIALMAFDHR
ncbi:MAG: hypothetical protein NTV43_14375 [Methylococcales bacterium]|nr:hypothetical protein [Methylococcales bacterium]